MPSTVLCTRDTIVNNSAFIKVYIKREDKQSVWVKYIIGQNNVMEKNRARKENKGNT